MGRVDKSASAEHDFPFDFCGELFRETLIRIALLRATLSLVVIVREVVDCVLLAFVTTTLEDGCHDYNLPLTLYKGRMNTVYMSRLMNESLAGQHCSIRRGCRSFAIGRPAPR
jgi:hypothetical protein